MALQITNLVAFSPNVSLGASAHDVAGALARTTAHAYNCGQDALASRLEAVMATYGWSLDIVDGQLVVGTAAQIRAWADAIVARDTKTCDRCAGRGFELTRASEAGVEVEVIVGDEPETGFEFKAVGF